MAGAGDMGGRELAEGLAFALPRLGGAGACVLNGVCIPHPFPRFLSRCLFSLLYSSYYSLVCVKLLRKINWV